eukprot:Hpha_TRINITY_DN15254_c4_g4::TRINITY_DN15254_c4_g4_i1::g.65899::m.65899
MADFVLGTWRGVWERGWTLLAALPAMSVSGQSPEVVDEAAVEEEAEVQHLPVSFTIFRHSADSGVCETIVASLRRGKWSFQSRSRWKSTEPWSSVAAFPAHHGSDRACGGLLLLFRLSDRTWVTFRVSEDGKADQENSGTLSEGSTHVAPTYDREGRPAVLVYASETGEARIHRVTDTIEEASLAAANVGAGWTALVPKEEAVQESSRRFLCYAPDSGLSVVRKLRFGTRRKTLAPPPGSDKVCQRRKDCMAVGVRLRGSPCCLFYHHTPPRLPEESPPSPSTKAVQDAAASTQPNLVLQRRIQCYRARWTALVPLEPHQSLGVGFLLCYAAAEGVLWVCTLATDPEGDTDSVSPQRSRAASAPLIYGGDDGRPFRYCSSLPPSPTLLWPGLPEPTSRSPTPQPPLLRPPRGQLAESPLPDFEEDGWSRRRCASALAAFRRRVPEAPDRVRRPWEAPAPEDIFELLRVPVGTQYREEVTGILNTLAKTPFGAATGYAALAERHVRRSENSSGRGGTEGAELVASLLAPPPPEKKRKAAVSRPSWLEVGSVSPARRPPPCIPRPPRTQKKVTATSARLVRPSNRPKWAEQRLVEYHAAFNHGRTGPRKLSKPGEERLTHRLFTEGVKKQTARRAKLEERHFAPLFKSQKLDQTTEEESAKRLCFLESEKRELHAEKRAQEFMPSPPKCTKPKAVLEEGGKRLYSEGIAARERAVERVQNSYKPPPPHPSGQVVELSSAQVQNMIDRLYVMRPGS